ncbi:hypothetical protein Rs2_38616 [Raphanus sativus]|nr:hypothetical protein Rs2_38616 [Raphanus sativus]
MESLKTIYILCKLFLHSLSRDASSWLNKLQLGSLTHLEDTKNVFLNEFLDNPTATQKSEIEAMPELILEGVQNMDIDFKEKLGLVHIKLDGKIVGLNTHVKKMDLVYIKPNGKLESLSHHVKKLDGQVAHRDGFVKMEVGILFGTNSKATW